MTSHPQMFDDRLIAAYAEVKKLAGHLHLPVQSGSDRILAAMKRNHTILEYKTKLRKLRDVRPDISITTDFIVGFPGETEEEDFEGRCGSSKRASTVPSVCLQPASRHAGGGISRRHTGRRQTRACSVCNSSTTLAPRPSSRQMVVTVQRILVRRSGAQGRARDFAGVRKTIAWLTSLRMTRPLSASSWMLKSPTLAYSLRGHPLSAPRQRTCPIKRRVWVYLNASPWVVTFRIERTTQAHRVQPFACRQSPARDALRVARRAPESKSRNTWAWRSPAVEIIFAFAGARRKARTPAQVLKELYADTAGLRTRARRRAHGVTAIRVARRTNAADRGNHVAYAPARGAGPRPARQRQYVRPILTHDINFGIGPAGIGKTYLAVAAAVRHWRRAEVVTMNCVRPRGHWSLGEFLPA